MPAKLQTEPVAENHLLASLVVHERNAVQRGSAVIACAAGQILLHSGTPAEHVLFPIDSVLAPVRTLDDGGRVELGLVGNDGMIGGDALLETNTRLDDVVVRSAGSAWCMPAEDFRHQFHRGGGLQKALLRFMNGFASQLAQNAACNRFHSVHARVARWLLMIHDRNAEAEIDVSGAAIAGTLPGDAAAVERALHDLAAEQTIRQRRSGLVIADPDTLESHACECYDKLRYV